MAKGNKKMSSRDARRLRTQQIIFLIVSVMIILAMVLSMINKWSAHLINDHYWDSPIFVVKRMKVNFYATFRYIVGTKTVEFPHADGITLRQLIYRVVDRYPDLRRELLDEKGDLYTHVHILLNGRDSPFLENKFDAELGKDDVISVFPAVGGG